MLIYIDISDREFPINIWSIKEKKEKRMIIIS